MAKTLFISDLHFGHKNALAFDNRPFSTIEDHDSKIIEGWNDAVKPEDTVWILGDISWHKSTDTVEIFKKLNGHKRLVKGNHDDKLLRNPDIRAQFEEVCDYKELRLDNGRKLVLCHYPIPCFRDHYYGAYHLYGHVHNGFEHHMMEHVKHDMTHLYDKPCNMYNVGCMMPYIRYAPRTLEDIVAACE